MRGCTAARLVGRRLTRGGILLLLLVVVLMVVLVLVLVLIHDINMEIVELLGRCAVRIGV